MGTSLPELATSVVAAIINNGDIAVRNIIGSNIFNVLCILGLTAIIYPIRAFQITPWDYAALLVLSFAILPMVIKGSKFSRHQSGLLFLAHLAYTIHLY